MKFCPKCTSAETWVAYCDSCRHKYVDSSYLCRHGDPEHFHHGCRRCGYKWRTDDVIDAKVVCDR